MRAVTVGLILLAFMAGCGSQQPPVRAPSLCTLNELQHELKCTLAGPSEVAEGSPITITVTLENTSRRATFHLLKQSLPSGRLVNDLFVVRQGGKPLRYDGMDLMVEYTERGPESYVTLPPRGVISGSVDLLDAGYPVGNVGVYEIEYPALFEDLYGGELPADKSARRTRLAKEFLPGSAYCNRVTVAVVPR